jgi:flagellar basal-body rod modification protein FlgD
MAAAAGIFNHAMTRVDALTGKPAAATDNSTAGTSGSSDNSDTSSATISANDFLTLLVTEMQNQDPTADTDPNEYIDQLVQVNSLEQLIDINQTLSTDLGSTAATANSSASSQTASASPGAAAARAAGVGGVTGAATQLRKAHAAQSDDAVGISGAAQSPNASHTAGNLGVPSANRAAQRVAHALDGRTRAQPKATTTSAAGQM